MKRLLTSLSLTFLVSALFGIFFKDILVFVIATILQILFFYFFNTIYGNYLRTKVAEQRIELEKQQSINTVPLNCPTCNHLQSVRMTLNEPILYNCDKCEIEIKADPVVKNYLTTNPIYFEK